MPRINKKLVMLTALCAATHAVGDMVTLTAIKDNTLQKNSTGAKANGAGRYMFVGKTAESATANLRRPVIQFDVSGIPAGSTVTEVYFTLYCSKAITSGMVSAYRCLSAWNEGTSVASGCNGNNEGCGGASVTGDSTWIHRVKPGTLWTNQGGDFDPVASDTKLVEGQGLTTTWGTTPRMIADVQAWVNSPASNNGWLLVGEEVADGGTAKRFNTRQNSDALTRPNLIVLYTPPSSAGNGDMDCSGGLNLDDIEPFVTALVDPDAYAIQFPGCPLTHGDVNGDSQFNGADIKNFAAALIIP